MSEFLDARVLVVGGSSGIGLATAAAFAAAGARVTIASRSADKLAAAVGAIARPVATAVLDLTSDDDVAAFFAAGEPWDHAVVSAAQTRGGPARQLPMADAQAAMNSKFWGAYRVARALRLREGGSLTLVSGQASQRPRGNAALQGAINSALETLARGLALELAPLRVNCVSPGTIDTPMWNRLADDARRAMFAETAQRLPVGRVGRPEDIAKAVLYLAGNGFATGTVLLCEGGSVLV